MCDSVKPSVCCFQGYDGEMSSTGTLRSTKYGSMASLDSMKSDPFSKSPRTSRKQMAMEDIPDGPSENFFSVAKHFSIKYENEIHCIQNNFNFKLWYRVENKISVSRDFSDVYLCFSGFCNLYIR